MPRECPPLFASNPQPPELIQPSEGPLDYPSPTPFPGVIILPGRNNKDRKG
jgi:hypothetical protein